MKDKGNEKSLKRLIHNLESDPDILLARELEAVRGELKSGDSSIESLKKRVQQAAKESAARFKVAMAHEMVHETATECGRRTLRERVARLNNLLSIKDTPYIFIVNEIVLVLQSAALYCPDFMGKAIMKDMHDSVCMDKGFCINCGAYIHNRKLGDAYCAKCEKKFKAMDSAAG